MTIPVTAGTRRSRAELPLRDLRDHRSDRLRLLPHVRPGIEDFGFLDHLPGRIRICRRPLGI
jgi:hypothetical protein